MCQLRLAFVEDDFLSVSCSKSPNYAMGCQCQRASSCLSRTYGGVVYIVDLWTGYQQCTIRSFLFRKLSIGKFKPQVSFSLGSFVSDKIFEMHFRFLLNIWLRVDCRPIASKFNLAKYIFDDTDIFAPSTAALPKMLF